MCKVKRVVYRVEVFYEQGGVTRCIEFTITKGRKRCFVKYDAPNAIVKAGSEWKFAGQYFVRSIVQNFLSLDHTLHQCLEACSPPAHDDFCSPAAETETGVGPEADSKGDATEAVGNRRESSVLVEVPKTSIKANEEPDQLDDSRPGITEGQPMLENISTDDHPEGSDEVSHTSTSRQNDVDSTQDLQVDSPLTSAGARVAVSASTAHQRLSLQERLAIEFYEQKLKYLQEEHDIKMKILQLQLEMLMERKMQPSQMSHQYQKQNK